MGLSSDQQKGLLTQQGLKKIVNYNPSTGLFTRLLSPEKVVGSINDGYLLIYIKGVRYRAHRLAWLYMVGEFPDRWVDHIDGDRANNMWDNLREATITENTCNSSTRADNTSGIKGVYWNKGRGKWRAQIQLHGKKHHVGYFSDIEEARVAMETYREELHGEWSNHG